MARGQLNPQETQDIATAMQKHLLFKKRSGRPLNRKQLAKVRQEMEKSVVRRRKSTSKATSYQIREHILKTRPKTRYA